MRPLRCRPLPCRALARRHELEDFGRHPPMISDSADASFLCPTAEEVAHLASRDAALGRLMAAVGPIRRERVPDPFMAIVHAIAGQQVSAAAQAAVWRRLRAAFPAFTPESLSLAAPEELRACGLSLRKAGYIGNIASRAASGDLDLAGLAHLDDEALCAGLCQLPGVGRWTAEMLMIFCLGRKNVLSAGDLGIQRGLRMLYHKREASATLLARCKKRYAPFASAASLYLWALAEGAGGAAYADPAREKPKKLRPSGAS